MRILITGGTGFLGQQLVEQLLSENHDLVLVSRQNPSNFMPFPGQVLPWPITEEYHSHLKNIEAVIHLAGEPIAEGRWSKERKQRIYDSRIQGTRDVVDLLRLMPKAHTLISGSAVGIYGNILQDELDESSPNGTGFLADLCRDWETEALRAQRPNLRVVTLRTGIVLGRRGGAMPRLEPLFRNHMGGPAGDGSQQMSWIHEQDWVNAVVYCLKDPSLSGPVNLTAPEPVTNKAFSISLAQIFGQGHVIAAPAFALQLALGEMATLALEGQRVIPKKLLNTKFKFLFSDLRTALVNLYDIDEHHRIPDEYFTASQWVPALIEKVFAFFADPSHQEKITPDIWDFKVLGMSTEKVGLGTLFNYEFKSHGFQVEWQGEVTKWNPPHHFSEEQIKGSYARWYLGHTFTPACGGTLIRNKVLFRMPLGSIGRIGGKWLTMKDLRNVFDGRKRAVAAIFADG